MISFKSFLTEGRDAPLYHGTSVDSVIDILNSGFISGASGNMASYKLMLSPDSHQGIRGISTTRSERFAAFWGGNLNSTVVLALDQARIVQKYKVIPVDHYYNKLSGQTHRKHPISGMRRPNNQFQEYIVTDKLPVSYIAKIICYSEDGKGEIIKSTNTSIPIEVKR